jgi:glycosyltransferase involved in cell wall biosynthesis
MYVSHFVQRYPPALGGSEAYFHRLGRSLRDAGAEVTVWTTTALDLPAFWSRRGRSLPAGATHEDGLTVRRYAPGLRWRGRRWLLKPLSLLAPPRGQRLLLPCNPISLAMWRDAGRFDGPCDAVHAAAFPYAWPIACGLRLARRRGVPFLLTPFLHLGDPDDPRDRTRRAYTAAGLRSLLREAERVFVQTPGEREAVKAAGVPADRIVLQGLGVDPAECTGGDRAAARVAWGVAEDECVIGHLANLSAEKGSTDLLCAAQRAWAAGGRFRVVLAGPAMPNFERSWDGFPGKHHVTRTGPLDDPGRGDFFAGIDAFALPSRSDSFGLVLLEAWANGLPNVGYRAGGVADLIRDGEDGLLVRCGDLDGLAAALVRLSGGAALRRTLGARGRERAAREFRWGDKLDLVRRVIEESVSAARGSACSASAR